MDYKDNSNEQNIEESETSEENEEYPQMIIDESKRFSLAKYVLIGLGIVFLISMSFAFWQPESGLPIFEACKTIIPPIITLILGYYFSQR